MKTTGERIKELRIKKGLTQEELGSLIGVKKAAIHKYENNLVTNLRRSRLAKLAQALNTSPIYLMGLEDEEGEISPTKQAYINKIMEMDDDQIARLNKLLDLWFESKE